MAAAAADRDDGFVLESFGSLPLITCFARNHGANPTARVWHIAVPSWNEMPVSVKHGLSRRFTVVRPDVEPLNGRVLFQKLPPCGLQQSINVRVLGLGQRKGVSHVPLRNNQTVEWGNGKTIADPKRILIFLNHLPRGVTERARRRHALIGNTSLPQVPASF